ncbi:MAG: lytic transglycosylase domain-containing protein [Methylococcales bacterium]|jgi:soluble lytic murein transglycosylase-like protein|nr:lytic transglycosylase domain-containing protein [Methylococcales bacterium]MBT7443366.1 lytic transglycosylase domain-containing protein [Methylococcales bacterium]
MHQLRKVIFGMSIFCIMTTSAIAQPMPDASFLAAIKSAVHDSPSFIDPIDAQVWLVDMSTRLKPRIKNLNERLTLLKLILAEAHKHDLEPELILAIIQVESNFDQYAISSAGARGLMQIMPFWIKEIGSPKDDLFNIKTNLRYGCAILKQYLKRDKGNLTRALARYNGSRRTDKYPLKVYQAIKHTWFKG